MFMRYAYVIIKVIRIRTSRRLFKAPKRLLKQALFMFQENNILSLRGITMGLLPITGGFVSLRVTCTWSFKGSNEMFDTVAYGTENVSIPPAWIFSNDFFE